MTRSTRLLIGGLAIVAALAAWFFLRSGSSDRVAIDLMAQFPTAKLKQPSPDVFEVVDATLAPFAAGDYSVEVTQGREKRLTEFKVVP